MCSYVGKPKARCVFVTIASASIGVVSTTASGQCLANELTKFTAFDPTTSAQFGNCVSISGEVALVGAWHDNVNMSGSAYIFRFDGAGWNEEAKLTAFDAAGGDWFGTSVAVRGDVAVIAAIFDDDGAPDSGSAYVFRFSDRKGQWTEEAKLTPSDPEADQEFGASVSISGDVVVVGAPRDDHAAGSDAGSVYVFRFDGTNWNQEIKLVASDAEAFDRFGESVAVYGNVIGIGAPNDDDACRDDPDCNSGSAYVFRFDAQSSQWIEEPKLTASDAAQDDEFGRSVSISTELAMIGAPFQASGSAYVFQFIGNIWIEEAKLIPFDAEGQQQFGLSVSISGDSAIAGAYLDENASGSAYVYQFHGSKWIDAAKLIASDALSGEELGRSVSVSGDVALVGAPNDDNNTGAAYLFRSLSDCNNNGTLDLCDIDSGTSKDTNNNGIPDECDCPGDLNGDGSVGASDLLILLAFWGPCAPVCLGDLDFDGHVGAADLLALLANWGPCP